MDVERIRPIYFELQGYVSQIPSPKHSGETIKKSHIQHYHDTIEELSKILEKSLDRYIVMTDFVSHSDRPSAFVNLADYRQKITGLIRRLHGEYFPGEPAPFGGQPGVVVQQSQHQNQSAVQQIKLELDGLVDKKLSEFSGDDKKSGFFKALKGILNTAKDSAVFLKQLFELARQFGISIDDLPGLFS